MIEPIHAKITFQGRILLVLILICMCQWLTAQPRFIASASEKEISKNDYVEVQFTIENANNIEHINPPLFKNFDIVSGPNQQTGMSNINGVVKQYVALGYVLKPLTTGIFTIPSAIAKADGKELRSNPVSITVSNNAKPHLSGGNSFNSPFANLTLDMPSEPPVQEYNDYIIHKGENIEDKIRKNIFVRVETNKSTCYVGEPIVATYKLYTRLKSESNVTKSPSLNGFSVSELPGPPNNALTTQKYNGRDYSVYILRKVQLFPLQPGNIELDPAEVENKITFIKAEYANSKKGDVFYDMLRDFSDAYTPPEAIQEKKVTLQSQSASITVNPLPEKNKPEDFKGAVGTFRIEAMLEKNQITTDDAGMLQVIISGEGNLQMINAPKLILPPGMEVFEPKSSENISKTNVPIRGEKIFSFPFTILKAGKYVIPGPVFSYFDPTSKTYKTINTVDLNLSVLQGTGVRNAGVATQSQTSSNSIKDFISRNVWLLITVLGFMIVMIKWFTKNNKQQKAAEVSEESQPALQKEESELSIPQNPFATAGEKLLQNDHRGFFHEMQHSLRSYLSGKLHLPPSDLTRKHINEQLDKFNVGIGTGLMLGSLMDEIDINLYAPLSNASQMEATYDKANEVVSLLNKQIP